MTFRTPLAAALGGSPDDVEERFYEALRRGDLEALMALWADEDDVACIRPGGPRSVGLAAIRAGFEAMFARGAFAARPQQVRRLQQIGCALHHLVERADPVGPEERVGRVGAPAPAGIAVTNFYVKTAQGWRLAVHHASSAASGDDDATAAPPAPPSTLH